MKRIRTALFALLFIIVGGCNAIQVDESPDLFTRAGKLYQKNEYEQALGLYKQITPKSAPVYYNMGNCAYKLDDYGRALLYWRRAEKMWGMFGRQELLENIAVLKKKQAEQRPEKEIVSVIKRWTHSFISWLRSVPLFFLQLTFLLLWFFLFMYLKLLSQQRYRFLITVLFCFIALFGTVLAIRYTIDYKTYGVVVRAQAPLLSGPSPSFSSIGTLYQADEITIQKKSGSYFKIRFGKRIGWVSAKDVEEV